MTMFGMVYVYVSTFVILVYVTLCEIVVVEGPRQRYVFKTWSILVAKTKNDRKLGEQPLPIEKTG